MQGINKLWNDRIFLAVMLATASVTIAFDEIVLFMILAISVMFGALAFGGLLWSAYREYSENGTVDVIGFFTSGEQAEQEEAEEDDCVSRDR